MTLIVARQDGSQIAVVSDTKLTYPDHEIKQQKTAPGEGVIKTVIISQNQCIAFAGEIDFAESALKKIGDSATDEQIIDVLKYYHILSECKTEFLYCTGNPVLLYEFKNNEFGPVPSCYLGDKEAFEIFQAYMMDKLPSKSQQEDYDTKQVDKRDSISGPVIEIEEFNLSIIPSISSSILSKMMSAMDYVIEMGSIQSVGGFKVFVGFNNGSFNYVRYNRMYRGNISLFGGGGHTIGHGTASDGAYSVHFFEGSSNYKSVALHIRQAQLGILYHRLDNGLLKPNLSKYDEIDFIDNVLSKYKIPVQLLTQDRMHKYLSEGRKHFDAKNFLIASELFGKSLVHATGKEKAVSLFYLGLAQWSMNNRNVAMFCFNEAVKIDPAIKSSITLAFQNKPHK